MVLIAAKIIAAITIHSTVLLANNLLDLFITLNYFVSIFFIIFVKNQANKS